jgi:signal transduction histidine kinase/TPR repeat protein
MKELEQPVNSLEKNSAPDTLEKISEGIRQAERMKRTDFLGAISRLETLLERINALEYDKFSQLYKLNYTTILTHLANIHYYSSKYAKALQYTKLLEEASEFYNDKKLKGNALLHFGNIHSDLGDFPEAMKYSTDALEIFKELEDKEGMGSTNNNIGNVFLFQNNFEEAFPHYEKALYYFNQVDQKMNKSNVLQNIASIHIHKEEYPKALSRLAEAEKLKEEINDSFGVAVCKFLTGDIHLDAKEFDTAIKYYHEALEIQTRLDDKNGILYSNMHLGKTYVEKFLTEGQKDKSQLAKAEKFYLESLFTAQRVNSKYTLSLIYKNLYVFYEIIGDIAKAFDYHKKMHTVEKEMFNEKVSEEVLKLEKELQVKEAKHNAEINQLRNVELAAMVKKLEEIVKQKNDFFGVVVHDLKNPIGNIKLLAEFLIDEGNYSKEEINEFKRYIVESADTSLELVTQLLDYAAIEQGKINLNITELDINSETERIIRLYKMKTMQKGITVNYRNELKDNIVMTDKNAIVQIIDNLFSNAIKFSPEEKSIMIKLSERDDFLKIEIKDEGPGFTEDDRKKLFNQFSKLSAKPTGGEHSSGLGLSIVKKLVDSLKGTIECESEKGNGSSMIVKVPLKQSV